jgi:prepilin-type processing-associated H-X9-DG protein
MRRLVKVAIVVLVLAVVGGVGVVFVGKLRHTAARITCQNNLKQLGLALHNYHDARGQFPSGTVPSPDLPPERRLSWVVEVWPTFIEGGTKTEFDRAKPWDAPENCPPYLLGRDYTPDDKVVWTRFAVGEIMWLLCPSNEARTAPPLPSPTHYVGVAGVGKDAAGLPLADARAGFFGYDRKLTREDVKGGTGATLALVEAADGGPWSAGGRATVRGVPHLGEGGLHRSGGPWPLAQPAATNVLFADGSVRHLTAATSTEVWEALATVAGKETVGPLEGE